MPHLDLDVVILGAGAAGLAAAAHLADARRTGLVLEARDRIGGRIWSHHEPGVPVPVEIGAEFIHGRATALFNLLQKSGAAAVSTSPAHWSLHEGKLKPAGRAFVEVCEAIRRTKALEKKDLSFGNFLERHLRPLLSDEATRFARRFAEGFDAADLTRASARAIAEEWAGEGSSDDAHFRPLGGFGALLDALAARLNGSRMRLRLRTVVREVRWKRRSVEVRGLFLGQPFRATASCAIVALPLGVLQQPARAEGAVRFTPALKEKRDALAHLASGPVLKALLRFRRAFWEEVDNGQYWDAAFFHAPDAAFPTFWAALPVRTPLLVAWAGGAKAMRLSGKNKAEIIGEALTSVTSIFGRQAAAQAQLESAWVHDWQSDPYARGGYSFVTVGGDDAHEQLAAPLKDTLFFAGEAADTEGEASTVAGALQSGVRAAREVLRSGRSR